MTRTIKASEVHPGMEVQFDLCGWDVKGTVVRMDLRPQSMWLYTDQGCEMSLDRDTPVTVLTEPQPEEPTEFGARVVAGGCRAQRGHGRAGAILPWVVEFPGGNTVSYDWEGICDLGQVTVIPDQGWTVPADSPEVPERIEEWPEDDTALRKHKWRDDDGYGDIWRYVSNSRGKGWICDYLFQDKPLYGPWTRVTDA